MLTADSSSWTPGRPGGAFRGVVDDVTDKKTHLLGERVLRCDHHHTTDADAVSCATAELRRILQERAVGGPDTRPAAGARRRRRPQLTPGSRCSADRTAKVNDPAVTILEVGRSYRRGVRTCGRCGRRNVPVQQSWGHRHTAWYYDTHDVPEKTVNRGRR